MKLPKRTLLFTIAAISMAFSSISSAFAEEYYYYKGAEKNQAVKSTSLTPWTSKDIGGSSVVIAASTVYDGRAVGKERVRA
ncbi:hypothetical protein J23TS9_42460 [Paenibacillus sp. J23TS9]|uniref:hypothetical protein n=1 Tax=Paenibacillus sp. J23TS9 TaxID=2807193 RepID=UPI001B056FCA|nr:hypothetical protein [Paenibacillus sp. J23TS9]GIP29116.1 hypothetical protein J23TS9_42460 [Paenibacillus sp. J23TS9]